MRLNIQIVFSARGRYYLVKNCEKIVIVPYLRILQLINDFELCHICTVE